MKGKRLDICRQSGEISPNLATLLTNERTNDDENRNRNFSKVKFLMKKRPCLWRLLMTKTTGKNYFERSTVIPHLLPRL